MPSCLELAHTAKTVRLRLRHRAERGFAVNLRDQVTRVTYQTASTHT
jgi:hypothetical protein